MKYTRRARLRWRFVPCRTIRWMDGSARGLNVMIRSLSRKGWIVCVIDNLRFFKKGGRIFLSLLASLLCCFVFERGGGEKGLYENFISQISTNQTMNFFFLRITGKIGDRFD